MSEERKKETSLQEMRKTAVDSAPDQAIDMFSARGFELAQRIAKSFATSSAVPEQFQASVAKREKGQIVAWTDNHAALGNCLVAIETARAVGMSITAVMQNANVIEGKLSWSGQFKIAAVNASKRFTPLRYRFERKGKIKASYQEKDGWDKEKGKWKFIKHEVEIENIECTAWAYIIENGRTTSDVVEGPTVSMKMAVEEGWYAKAGSKWQTSLRDKMLFLRAGAYFSDIYAPDIVMGMGITSEESEDIIEVHQQSDGSYQANMDELRSRNKPSFKEGKPEVAEAETVDVKETVATKPEPEPDPDTGDAQEPEDLEPKKTVRPTKKMNLE